MRILIVEDELKIAKVIAAALRRENYAVDVVHDGDEGLSMAESQPYALIVLDRMIPGISGTEIVKKLRAAKNSVPILFLTALGTTEDKTAGLDIGADDYLVKPFALDELLARIRALLRRPSISQSDTLTIDNLKLDRQTKTVSRDGQNLELTSKEYSLLEYLMQYPGQTLSKEKLISNVWDFDADILPNNVEVYIKNLRKKIDKPFKKPLIKTVRGFGYKISQ